MTNLTPESAEVAPVQPLETAGGAPLTPTTPVVPANVTPTQVRKPWRATARTLFQSLIAMCVLLPFLVEATGLNTEDGPWLLIPLGVAAAVARIMALPQVEVFLQTYLPWLSAAGRQDGRA